MKYYDSTDNYIRERYNCLLHIIVSRGDVYKHEGFSVTTEGVLHQHGQLVVTVGDKLLVTAQCGDDITKGRQRLVDGHCFLWTYTMLTVSSITLTFLNIKT